MKRRIMIIWTALFRWIGKLYSSLRTLAHLLFLQDAIVITLVIDLLRIDSLLYWIDFVRKRAAKRKFHDRKGALFTGNPDSWAELSGKWLAEYRDTKPASEVC